MLGDWDAAEQALSRGEDGLDDETVTATLAIFAALRGEPATATAHAALPGCRISEDPQDRAEVALVDALIAAAEHRPADALRHASAILDHEAALGLASEFYYLAWPTATRAAFELGRHDTVHHLLAQLDAHPLGHLPPILRAERTLARARLAAADHDPAADTALADAITQFRTAASPYHLAHALLDHAQHRTTNGTGPIDPLIDEATTIADQLHATPLTERATTLGAIATTKTAGSSVPR
jgi:hypothetical protein